MSSSDDVAERKRKRLEAWRKRNQKPVVKMTLNIKPPMARKKNKPTTAVQLMNVFGQNDNEDGDDEDDDDDEISNPRKKPMLLLNLQEDEVPPKRDRKRRKWDTEAVGDALDTFMEKLQDGAVGSITSTTALENDTTTPLVNVNVGGSMMRPKWNTDLATANGSADTSTEQPVRKTKKVNDATGAPIYTPSDWETSASEAETEDEEEDQARRKFIQALKSAPAPNLVQRPQQGDDDNIEEDSKTAHHLETAAQVRSEKQHRQDMLKSLEVQAIAARQAAADAPDFGRLYNDAEDGIMEEAERSLDAAMAAPMDALDVLAELNKKKELKAVNHSNIDYIPFRKNLYIVPRRLASLTHDELINCRAKLKIRVRGQGAPAPVSSFEECGLSERVLKLLHADEITTPYPVQAQCIPCIMAGRDVIGIAKTGSGKTLAYLLPLLRHIADQPPLQPHESGPIGLILAPARELAAQIHSVCKVYAKHLGFKTTVVYGGAAVAEQIGDLKRGVHIAVATPGRLIDILTMQSGKILSLQRVTYVVLDEADRIFDMGFSSQIGAILAAVRPDRQTVLFSATFPKTVEIVARKALKFPIEVMVGGRSVASDSVTQYADLVEEESKFLRLLQLLGEYVEGNNKAIVFVGTQVKADSIFEQLLRCGYVSLSLHGGKEQEDRDSTISDFKRKDGPGVLVATGVAGRGLDVPSCCCVINYSAPNHLEAYVHQVGRTGRAGKKGVAYTFCNSTDEALYAPIITRALTESGQAENISAELKALSDSFKEKVKRGEAKFAGSGFKGKGYTYDSTELSEAQKLARMEKRQALIEAGLVDPDDDDPYMTETPYNDTTATEHETNDDPGTNTTTTQDDKTDDDEIVVPDNLTPELLALPGMKQAILKKAGILQESKNTTSSLDTDSSSGKVVQLGPSHYLQEFEINDYPREARWKVTQKDTTSRLQDEFQTAVTLKGSYFPPGKIPAKNERRLYLHLEAKAEMILKKCVLEVQRLLNEETLRVGGRSSSTISSHKYNVM